MDQRLAYSSKALVHPCLASGAETFRVSLKGSRFCYRLYLVSILFRNKSLVTIPLAMIPVATIPLATIPLMTIPLMTIPLVITHLVTIPLMTIPLATTPSVKIPLI